MAGNSSGLFGWLDGIYGGGSGGVDMANPASLTANSPQGLLGSLPASPNVEGGSNWSPGMFGISGGQQIGGGGLFGNSGLGMNMGTLQLGTAGLGGLFQMFQGMQANKLANKSFELAKSTANTNIANQIKSYNTKLTDTARTRAFVEGQTPEQERDYIARNSLSR